MGRLYFCSVYIYISLILRPTNKIFRFLVSDLPVCIFSFICCVQLQPKLLDRFEFCRAVFEQLFHAGVWMFARFVRPLLATILCVWEIWSGSNNRVYMYLPISLVVNKKILLKMKKIKLKADLWTETRFLGIHLLQRSLEWMKMIEGEMDRSHPISMITVNCMNAWMHACMHAKYVPLTNEMSWPLTLASCCLSPVR